MEVITWTVSLLLLLLYIIMIVKFFQIAKDTEEIKIQNKELLDLLRIHFTPTTANQTEVHKEVEISEIPGYIEQDGTIIFDDGVTGQIGCVFGSFGYKNDEGVPVYFSTKEECIKEIYKYKVRSSK